jgi:hypothetical protein
VPLTRLAIAAFTFGFALSVLGSFLGLVSSLVLSLTLGTLSLRILNTTLAIALGTEGLFQGQQAIR